MSTQTRIKPPATGKILKEEIAAIVAEAQSRVNGAGGTEYGTDETVQKFESMDLDDLFDYFVEELLDQINYAVMNIIRVRALKTEVVRFADEVSNVGWLANRVKTNTMRRTNT
jgi:hypothetical protein